MNGDDVQGTVLADVALNFLMAFVVMVWIAIQHLSPPTQQEKSKPPGTISACISWPSGDFDVDLWAHGPGEMAPVGYSNKGGVLFNLLRDDLGARPDATDRNFECAFSRGVVPGRYWINVHAYRVMKLPLEVHVEVQINDGDKLRPVVATKVILTRGGDEKTAVSFVMKPDGYVEAGSLNSIYKPLRSN